MKYKRFSNNWGKTELICSGEWELPIVRLCKINKIPQNWINFGQVKSFRGDKSSTGVHFFIDDYQFERVWNFPEKYMRMLSSFAAVIAPDFSLYEDYPFCFQLWNAYRNRWIAQYWQQNGINVIANLRFSSKLIVSDGLPQNSIVAVSSVGYMKSDKFRKIFVDGFKKMIEELDPIKILFFGVVPCGVDCNIIINYNTQVERFKK